MTRLILWIPFAWLICAPMLAAAPASASANDSPDKAFTELQLDSLVAAYEKMPLDAAENRLLAVMHGSTSDSRRNMQSWRVLSQLRLQKGKTVEALDAAERALSLAERHHQQQEMGPALILVGEIYSRENQREKALDNFLKAAPFAEQYNEGFVPFSAYYHAANIQYGAENYLESAELLTKALHFYQTNTPDFRGYTRLFDVMSAWNTLGLVYGRLQRTADALIAFRASHRLAAQLRNGFWMGLVTGNIGHLYYRTGLYDSALVLCRYDKYISLAHQQWQTAANAIYVMGNTYEKLGRRAEARHAFDTVGVLIKAHGLTMPEYYNKIAGFYAEAGDYKMAFAMTRKFQATRDSLLSLRNSREKANIQASYEFERKLAAHNLLLKESQLKDEQLKAQSFLMFTIALGLGLALVLITILYRRNRVRKKVNKDLEDKVRVRTRKLLETNRELDTFLYRSSHDLRRPITTIIGLHNLGQHLVREQTAQEILEKINITAHAMDQMLLKLTTAHDLNSHFVELSIIRINELVSDVVKKFERELHAQQISVTVDTDETRFVSDEKLLRIVLMNLIDNAINFTNPATPNVIRIRLVEDTGVILLEVADRGTGIAQPFRKEIFKPFFRGSERSKGNGLGLYLVKKALDKLGGKITFETEEGQGTSFSITIPNV